MSLFNLGTRKNSSIENAKEGVEYVMYKDGNGFEVKILNLDHEMYAPKEGIVELEPLKVPKNASGAVRHLSDVSWEVVRDRSSGFLIGIPLTINPETKKIIWQGLNLKGKETLDLSIPDQRAKWICIKFSHFYNKSPNFQSSVKMAYKAVDKEAEAESYEIVRRKRRKAVDIADALVGEELNDVALMLGYDPLVMTKSQLYMEVNKYVENPNKLEGGKTGAEIFMEIYTSETRAELAILKRGLATGILNETHDTGITYRGISLGFTQSEALTYLRSNPSTKNSIDIQSKQSQEGTNVSMGKTVKVDPREELIKKQAAELAELKARAAKLENPESEGEDTELEELIKEGHNLQIKGIHRVGANRPIEERKSLIRQKIDAVKTSVE